MARYFISIGRIFCVMLQKTEGIVFRTIKYSETSVVTHIYTRHFGLLSFIVPGVRTSKAKRNKAGMLQPMSMLEMDIYHKETANLLRLKDYRNNYLYQSLPFDVVKTTIGFFYTDILTHVIREQEPNEALYLFIVHAYVELDQANGNLALMPQRFLLKLSTHLGFQPENNYSPDRNLFDMSEGSFSNVPVRLMSGMPQDVSLVFHRFLSDPDSPLAFTHEQRRQLLSYMLEYYKLHVSNFGDMKSVRVLEDVLS